MRHVAFSKAINPAPNISRRRWLTAGSAESQASGLQLRLRQEIQGDSANADVQDRTLAFGAASMEHGYMAVKHCHPLCDAAMPSLACEQFELLLDCAL